MRFQLFASVVQGDCRWRIRIPAAAQRFVQRDQRGRGLRACLREPVFGVELFAFGIEQVDEVGGTGLEAYPRELTGAVAGMTAFAEKVDLVTVCAVGLEAVRGVVESGPNAPLDA